MTDATTLPDRLDTSAAPALAGSLLALRGRPLTLDASGVVVAGARAMEVLIAAGRLWRADGLPIAVIAPSDRFAAVCTTLGLRPDAPWRAATDSSGTLT